MSPFTVLASTLDASTTCMVMSPFTVCAATSPELLTTSTSSLTELRLMRPLAPLGPGAPRHGGARHPPLTLIGGAGLPPPAFSLPGRAPAPPAVRVDVD